MIQRDFQTNVSTTIWHLVYHLGHAIQKNCHIPSHMNQALLRADIPDSCLFHC